VYNLHVTYAFDVYGSVKLNKANAGLDRAVCLLLNKGYFQTASTATTHTIVFRFNTALARAAAAAKLDGSTFASKLTIERQ